MPQEEIPKEKPMSEIPRTERERKLLELKDKFQKASEYISFVRDDPISVGSFRADFSKIKPGQTAQDIPDFENPDGSTGYVEVRFSSAKLNLLKSQLKELEGILSEIEKVDEEFPKEK